MEGGGDCSNTAITPPPQSDKQARYTTKQVDIDIQPLLLKKVSKEK
jgi:hypothetical protein